MCKDSTPSKLAPADNPAVTAHVTMLQSIISRLAGNSASCKTWCLTLVAALLALAGATRSPTLIAISLLPVIVFGFLDAMYLTQERAYRDLFNTVVGKVRDGSYDRSDAYNAKPFVPAGSFFGALSSWSIWLVYGGLLAAYIVADRAGWLQLIAAVPK